MSEPTETLYAELGGEAGVTALVDEMYRRVLADHQLGPFFANTDITRLKQMQVAFISAMVDGPVRYSGSELTEIHRGRGIERQHFSAFCGHLVDAMTARQVSGRVADQILARLAMFADKITGSTSAGS
jgi:hemoglobin